MQQKPYILILVKKLLSLTVISQGDFKKKLPPLTSQSSNFLVHDIQKYVSSGWGFYPVVGQLSPHSYKVKLGKTT